MKPFELIAVLVGLLAVVATLLCVGQLVAGIFAGDLSAVRSRAAAYGVIAILAGGVLAILTMITKSDK